MTEETQTPDAGETGAEEEQEGEGAEGAETGTDPVE